ncbi:signal peptidase [bacterium]|uniref:PSP1 domain protein n=1 Tax=Rubinisphaera brasiliensis (strain ATCC 49424 / DSM 5305 / JCM 21570 / IAM 15109 / NBRC 103401 / IFAM 1448) TaxID=756272 RepID=F0ST50_RUBBR|nr:regulatory iron-sulfur-containing complex subunit RicT [Rubinisphaera brasiliensis]ADY59261.1 PSP1 domain protein [Rubinisphaera brasiliensis DSM 5305]MBR9800891.1 signal peptidase [bacterium]
MENQPPERYLVRYGTMRLIAPFSWKGKEELKRGESVVVRTKRGTEWAQVLGEATERAVEFLKSNETEGKILRQATVDDASQYDACRAREQLEFDGCNRMIADRKLQMQLVDVEHLFGNERAIFYFIAENRVDFRDLVKGLAREYSLRIEMRQIGVRDEAALLADYGDCGKPVCCNTHLSEMPPVSMKMAKVQKATLDPNKISGRCGRLKCCLRYEFDTYEEFRRELPRVGAEVLTREGQGKVIGQEILSQKVLIAYEDRRRVLTPLQEIVSVIKKTKQGGDRKKKKPNTKNNSGEVDTVDASDL